MRSLMWCCSRYKGLGFTRWSAMKLERWLTMSRQRSGLQIHLWGQWGTTFLLGWATVQIPLQRGQPTVLYKGNHSKIKKKKALTQGEQLRQPCIDTQQKRQTQFDIRLSGVVSRNPATVDLFPIEWTQTGAGDANNAVWGYVQGLVVKGQTGDSGQLSPSSGGGSDIKCCFHSCDAEPPSP